LRNGVLIFDITPYNGFFLLQFWGETCSEVGFPNRRDVIDGQILTE